MEDEKPDSQNEDKTSLGRSVDMGDLKGELMKRSDGLSEGTASQDFGDLKNELGKGKGKGK